jgi:hypothetical protein
VKKRKWLLRYELEEVDWRKEGREAMIAGEEKMGAASAVREGIILFF